MLNLKALQPLDRTAGLLILALNLGIILLILGGNHAVPRVREFSWQNRVIRATDTAFILTFTRPLDQASVEANLQIDPPLPGKISWVGRRLVYTLTAPVRYETTYQVKLKKIQSVSPDQSTQEIEPFLGQFRTPDRRFAYIGVEGEEKGRLILYNLTRQQKAILTPKNLVIKDFKVYPNGDRILLAASDWSNYRPGLFEQSLYTVTLNPAKIDLVLGNQDYENLRFELSPDGQIIAVQRVNRSNLEDIGLWVFKPGEKPPWQRILNRPAGEFVITPDSRSFANPQAEGIAILPLIPNAKSLDFFPNFRRVLAFTQDGRQSVMLKDNRDGSQALFLVTNQGIKKELIQRAGEILNCQFDPATPTLYCLLIQRQQAQDFSEVLILKSINLTTFKGEKRLVLPDQWETKMSLSPDGSELLLDRVINQEKEPELGELRTEGGTAIATSSLWIVSLNKRPGSNDFLLSPQPLPLKGFRPKWIP